MPTDTTSAEPSAELGLAAARAFIDAFNAQDHVALAATLNYPHVRLANGAFTTVDTADEFVERSRRGASVLAAEGWHHTTITDIAAVHAGPDKVHVALGIDRCHEDGTVYNHFDTLWVATLQDGHWGIQFRSSYLR